MRFGTRLSSVPARGVVVAAAAVLLVPTSAGATKPPKPPSGGGTGAGFSTTTTYLKNYANVVNSTEYDLTPADVQTTPDGGWIALAITQSATNRVGVAWLLKASAVG